MFADKASPRLPPPVPPLLLLHRINTSFHGGWFNLIPTRSVQRRARARVCVPSSHSATNERCAKSIEYSLDGSRTVFLYTWMHHVYSFHPSDRAFFSRSTTDGCKSARRSKDGKEKKTETDGLLTDHDSTTGGGGLTPCACCARCA